MSTRVLHGNCRSVLRTLPDASVHMCVTSPPYWGLRDYGTAQWEGGDPACDHARPSTKVSASSTTLRRGRGLYDKEKAFVPGYPFRDQCGKCGAVRIDQQIGLEATPSDYVAALVEVFREVRRVLRDDGVLWLNLGDCYAATGKSGGGAQGARWEEAGAQVCGPRGGKWSPAPPGLKPKDLVGIPWAVAFALRDDGWYLRSALPWLKRSCMPESVIDRPTTALEYVFLLTKNECYFWDAVAVAREGAIPAGTMAAKGSASRVAQKGVNARPPEYKEYSGTRNFRNSDLFFDSLEPPHGLITDADGEPLALDVNTHPFPEAHFATFPPRLIEPLIKAGTSERGCCPHCGAPWERETADEFSPQSDVSLERGIRGALGQKPMDASNGWTGVPRGITVRRTTGWQPTCSCPPHDPIPATVLDPFIGSGTTALVADRLGRHCIGIDLSTDYAAMAGNRVRSDAPLFADIATE